MLDANIFVSKILSNGNLESYFRGRDAMQHLYINSRYDYFIYRRMYEEFAGTGDGLPEELPESLKENQQVYDAIIRQFKSCKNIKQKEKKSKKEWERIYRSMFG
jgi:hypothetical protein